MNIDFLPSYSLETEQALIGCALISGEAPSIPAESFYRDSHRTIVATMQAMKEKDRPIDLVSTWESLRAADKIEEIGGATYLGELASLVADGGNMADYERYVVKHFQSRQLQSKFVQIGADAQNASPEKAMQWLAEIERAVCLCDQEGECQPIFNGIKALIKDQDEKRERGGGLLGVSSGLSDLDKLTSGLCASDLIIVAGRPGMGKTALATAIAANVAKQGNSVLFFSLEMSRDQLLYRIVAQESGVDLLKLRSGTLAGADYLRAMHAMEQVSPLPLYVDPTPQLSEVEIAARVKKQMPCLVLIDYLGFMRCSTKEDRRDLEIARITGGLKALAKEMKVPIILLAQLNRKLEERGSKERRPYLSDLRESGSIEQDADLVIFVYRESQYSQDQKHRGIAELIIGKQRNGPCGVVPVAFHAPSTGFHDLAREEVEAFWRTAKK